MIKKNSVFLSLAIVFLVICNRTHVSAEICLFDDRFENNDTLESATPWELSRSESILFSSTGDDDFFAFDIYAGGILEISCLFSNDGGDIDISLLDENGMLLVNSVSSDDNEFIEYSVPANKRVYLRVYMYSQDECNRYELSVLEYFEPNQEICWDGIDNDGDSAVDCDDYGCSSMPPDYFGLYNPLENDVVGGMVVLEGSINDNGKMTDNFYYTIHVCGPKPIANCHLIDPLTPQFTQPKINETIGVWDTIGLGIPDGQYWFELYFQPSCRYYSKYVNITVDNTSPTAVIQSPDTCTALTGIVPIIGTAKDANIASWQLQYSDPASNSWITIANDVESVNNDLLTEWDTSSLDSCSTTLRLRVADKAIVNGNVNGHVSEYLVPVKIGFQGDTNNDKSVDLKDLAVMAAQWLMTW